MGVGGIPLVTTHGHVSHTLINSKFEACCCCHFVVVGRTAEDATAFHLPCAIYANDIGGIIIINSSIPVSHAFYELMFRNGHIQQMTVMVLQSSFVPYFNQVA